VCRVQRLPELTVLAHPIAIAADGDEVAVMDEAIDELRGHDVVAKDVASLFEALIRREHRQTPKLTQKQRDGGSIGAQKPCATTINRVHKRSITTRMSAVSGESTISVAGYRMRPVGAIPAPHRNQRRKHGEQTWSRLSESGY
jgi:hypothetical protein